MEKKTVLVGGGTFIGKLLHSTISAKASFKGVRNEGKKKSCHDFNKGDYARRLTNQMTNVRKSSTMECVVWTLAAGDNAIF